VHPVVEAESSGSNLHQLAEALAQTLPATLSSPYVSQCFWENYSVASCETASRRGRKLLQLSVFLSEKKRGFTICSQPKHSYSLVEGAEAWRRYTDYFIRFSVLVSEERSRDHSRASYDALQKDWSCIREVFEAHNIKWFSLSTQGHNLQSSKGKQRGFISQPIVLLPSYGKIKLQINTRRYKDTLPGHVKHLTDNAKTWMSKGTALHTERKNSTHFWLANTLRIVARGFLGSPWIMYRIPAWLRQAGPSGSPSPSPAAAGPPRAGCSGPRPGGFRRPPRRRSHSLWAACASAPSPAQHSSAPGVQREPPVLQFVPLALAPGTTGRSLAPFSLCSPFKYLYTLMKSLWASPSSSWAT